MFTLSTKWLLFLMIVGSWSLLSAQPFYNLSRPESSFIDLDVTEDVAYLYETTHFVKGQSGTWNFQVGAREWACVYVFDDQSRPAEAILYLDKEDVMAYLKLQHDDRGELRQITGRNWFQAVGDTTSYHYDRKGAITRIDHRRGGAQPISQRTYTSPKKHYLEERINVTDHPLSFQTTYFKQQVQQRSAIDSTGAVVSTQHFTYDKNGRLTGRTIDLVDPERADAAISYEYLLDERGNWIQMLEHQQATGRYRIVQRQLVYREKLPEPAAAESPIGQWNCGIHGLVLKAEMDRTFTLIDNYKRRVEQGTWQPEGWGRYTFQIGYQGRFGGRPGLRDGNRLTAELRPGRLLLYDEDDTSMHYDFTAEALSPTDEFSKVQQEYLRWDKLLWKKPGERAEDAIPADLAAAFENPRPIAPDRYKVCLDGQCGVVTREGLVLIPFAYDDINLALPGYYIYRSDGKAGLIDNDGQEVLPPAYDRIWLEPKLGNTIFGTRGANGRFYYDVATREFLPYEKEDLRDLNDERCIIRDDGDWLLCDRDFQPITERGKYLFIKMLSSERYLARTRNDFQILDRDGNVLSILEGYRDIRQVVYGYLTGTASERKLYALLDHDGKAITAPIYSQLTFLQDAKEQYALMWELQAKNAIAKFRKPNGEEGYLTGLGREVE